MTDDVFSSQIRPFSKVLEFFFFLAFGLAELLLLSLHFYVSLHVVYFQTDIPFQLHGRCSCLVIGVFSGLE